MPLVPLKAHADRKGYRYSVKIDSDGKKQTNKQKTSKQVTMCLKIYVGLGEKRKRAEEVLKKGIE